MRLPAFILSPLAAFADRIILNREPDEIIGEPNDPYMLRWFAIRKNPFFGVMVHQFMRSDDDRALHDHPWPNVSILLIGRYIEHTIAAGGVNHRKVYRSGDIKIRRAKSAHRIELTNRECITLFIRGPKVREWGFHCAQAGWRHWRDYCKPGDRNQVGRGCA